MALLETGILIEPDDVQILNGDFKIGDANQENIKHLCIANPGQFLISPIIGARLYSSQNSPLNDARGLAASIRSTLRNDGYDSVRIDGETNIETGEVEINITATRTRKTKRATI